MKRMFALAVGLVMAIGVSTSAFCADATLNLDANSAYVSRGVTYNDGLVLQPSLDVLKGGFDINIWGNMDIDDYDGALDSGEFSEVDLAMYYSHSFDKLTVTGGIIEYIYPLTSKTGGESTEELYVGGSLAIVDGLSLGLSVYYDIDEFKDTCYSNLSLAYSYPVNKQLGITAGLAAGYVERDSEFGDSGFNDYKLSLKATYALTDMIGIGANINYTDAIDDDVLATVDVNMFGGVSVNCKF
ncbi:MAG: hypothetical protein WC799_18095 [Desulfobacteraceae bacterium]